MYTNRNQLSFCILTQTSENLVDLRMGRSFVMAENDTMSAHVVQKRNN